ETPRGGWLAVGNRVLAEGAAVAGDRCDRLGGTIDTPHAATRRDEQVARAVEGDVLGLDAGIARRTPFASPRGAHGVTGAGDDREETGGGVDAPDARAVGDQERAVRLRDERRDAGEAGLARWDSLALAAGAETRDDRWLTGRMVETLDDGVDRLVLVPDRRADEEVARGVGRETMAWDRVVEAGVGRLVAGILAEAAGRSRRDAPRRRGHAAAAEVQVVPEDQVAGAVVGDGVRIREAGLGRGQPIPAEVARVVPGDGCDLAGEGVATCDVDAGGGEEIPRRVEREMQAATCPEARDVA